jgi:ABC-type multidrug transport system permease subunit
VNVALELITDPQTLVLDEPTSGLSSTDALSLMMLLRGLADSGKAILLTIHQPSVEVLKLLDSLAVVARDASTGEVGELAWYGPAYPDAAAFFEPDNPTPDAESVLRGLEQRPVADWRTDYAATPAYERWTAMRRSKPGSPAGHRRHRGGSLLDGAAQWSVLVRRMLAIKAADPWNTAVLVLQAPLIGLLVAGVFGSRITAAPDRDTWTDISQALAASCFLLGLAAVWFGCANAARELVAERAIYRRERMVGLGRLPYLASKLFVLTGLCAAQCAVLLLVGGRGLENRFSGTFATLFLAAGAATAIGLCISALARSTEAAAGLLPLVILPMVILGGILVPLLDLPGPALVLADAMPSRWAFEGLFVPESRQRTLLEVPIVAEPQASGEASTRATTAWRDMAEPWFPLDRGRSSDATPAVMLLATWLLAIAALATILRRRDRQDGR